MSGSGGLVSCVGGCNSKLFNSRRVHRPLIELSSDKALKFFEPRPASDTSEQSSNRQNRLESITLPMPSVANVKKSRKRRDRRYFNYTFDGNFNYINVHLHILGCPVFQMIQRSELNMILMMRIHRNLNR